MSFDQLNKYTEKITTLPFDRYEISLNDLLKVCIHIGKLKFKRTYDFNTDLMHLSSEVGEIFGEWRDNRGYDEIYFKKDKSGRNKPEGIPIELADVVIKALSIAEKYNIDLLTGIETKLSYIAGKEDK